MSFVLSPVLQLDKTDWIEDRSVHRIISVLGGEEERPQTMFVGGCVRNALISKPVEDIDMSTIHAPDVVMDKLEGAGVHVIPTGIEHGTVTAVLEGRIVEITTLRRDIKTDGRYAEVAYTDDWLADARRRDFTMNTLLADAKGQIYDPLGCGAEDLRARKVVFVGNPEQRIKEDYLRILRFFRFHALYGKGTPDEAALAACQELAPNIDSLSKERITQEFFKILAAKAPHEILEQMFECGVLGSFRHKDYDAKRLEALCFFQERYRLAALSSRLFVLAGGKEKHLKEMGRYLLIPKIFLRDFTALEQAASLPDLSDSQAVRRCVYYCGRSITAQALMIELADDRVNNSYGSEALKIVQGWDVPSLPISGHDLMAAGIKKGPQLGKTLHEIENWWVEQGFTGDKQACLARL